MSDQEVFENYFNSFFSFYEQQQKIVPYNFNVLDEQCGHIVENSHTQMLMKLLKYRSFRGYNFLEDFLGFLGLDIVVKNNVEVKFKSEAYYEGVNNNGRIDGLIYQTNQFVLIIENKVNGAGNQKEQLKKYIEGVCSDENIFDASLSLASRYERVWVVFLTKDGAEEPDKDSVNMMRNIGICNSPDEDIDEISGPRYASINYRDHILPWLKENIQPCVMQKEQVLNTGLLQYIDFLEGMLGLRLSEQSMMKNCKEWLKKELSLPKDFKGINSKLNGLRQFLIKRLRELRKQKVNQQEQLQRCAEVLLILIGEFNQDPLVNFYNVTRRFFTSSSNSVLMKECSVSAVFNYYYIQIRETSWPRSIHFEWYPMGVKRLCEKTELKLCFHVESVKKIRDAFDNDKHLTDLFHQQGFKKSGVDFKCQRNLSFVKAIDVSKPIMKMDDNEMDLFLTDAYRCITKEIVDRINIILMEVYDGV